MSHFMLFTCIAILVKMNSENYFFIGRERKQFTEIGITTALPPCKLLTAPIEFSLDPFPYERQTWLLLVTSQFNLAIQLQVTLALFRRGRLQHKCYESFRLKNKQTLTGKSVHATSKQVVYVPTAHPAAAGVNCSPLYPNMVRGVARVVHCALPLDEQSCAGIWAKIAFLKNNNPLLNTLVLPKTAAV